MPKEPDSLLPGADVAGWIAAAHNGDQEALNRLLTLCRPYLLLVANQDLDPALQARVAPSDVVQESLMEAARDFPHFRGQTEADLLAWFRGVLRHNLETEHKKHVETQLRSVAREVPLADAPLAELQKNLVDQAETPSTQAQARERDQALHQALAYLPERYRQALQLHTCEGLTFAQVGERLGCSAEAARKLYSRAAEQLAQLLGKQP